MLNAIERDRAHERCIPSVVISIDVSRGRSASGILMQTRSWSWVSFLTFIAYMNADTERAVLSTYKCTLASLITVGKSFLKMMNMRAPVWSHEVHHTGLSHDLRERH